MHMRGHAHREAGSLLQRPCSSHSAMQRRHVRRSQKGPTSSTLPSSLRYLMSHDRSAAMLAAPACREFALALNRKIVLYLKCEIYGFRFRANLSEREILAAVGVCRQGAVGARGMARGDWGRGADVGVHSQLSNADTGRGPLLRRTGSTRRRDAGQGLRADIRRPPKPRGQTHSAWPGPNGRRACVCAQARDRGTGSAGGGPHAGSMQPRRAVRVSDFARVRVRRGPAMRSPPRGRGGAAQTDAL